MSLVADSTGAVNTNLRSCGSKCGQLHRKLAGSKTFKCPECGHTMDRDLNCAFNILLKALRDTSISGELTAYQIMPYTVDLGFFLNLPG